MEGPMRIIRQTRPLPGGTELESEFEQRGDRLRIRLRLCRDNLVVRAHRATLSIKDALRREWLPREFGDDVEVQAAVFDPIEEMWKHRLRLF
jgi:hypothetical protein